MPMPFFSSPVFSNFFCLLNKDQEENNAGDFHVGCLVLFSNFLFVYEGRLRGILLYSCYFQDGFSCTWLVDLAAFVRIVEWYIRKEKKNW